MSLGVVWRVLLPVVCAWVVAIVVIRVPWWPLAWVLWGVAGVALVAAVEVRKGPGRARRAMPLVALCLCASALVGTVAAVQAPARQPDSLVSFADDRRIVTVYGTVISTPIEQSSPFGFDSAKRVRFALRIEAVQAGRGPVVQGYSVPAKAFGQLADGAPRPDIGARVALTARLQKAEVFEPTAFQLFGKGTLRIENGPPWYLGWAAALRADFRASATLLPGDGGALLPGLAIGDTTAVSSELDAAMKASSLSHLTAVSGANCAIVVAAIMLLGGLLRFRRGLRIGLSIVVLAGFVVLVTPEASVLRAGVMTVIVLCGLASGRPGGGVPALGLATLILVVLDPWIAASYGFALSVLATAGLLLLTAPLTALLSRWMPQALALTLAIPLAAQLACQPVLVLLSPTVSFLGVPANLLAGPAAPIGTILGLIACLLMPVLPSLGFALAQIAWLPATWIAAVASTVAAMPGSSGPWVGGAIGAVLLAVATAAALWLLLRGSARRHRSTTLATVAWLSLIALVGAYGGVLLGTGVVRSLGRPNDWQIALCDVGQGDAIVLRDGDYVGLIDTGPEPKRVQACLRTLGITHIDLLVLTHFDHDHVGGLDAVRGIVDTVLVQPISNPRDDRTIAPLREGGAIVRVATRGDRGTLGELHWRVLWPADTEGPFSAGNPGSVVLETDGRGIHSVFLGDLGESSERALLGLEKLGSVDVVKVAHHGSSDQDPELYRELKAKVGLIGVGVENGYGHPTDSLLSTLHDAQTRAYRTDTNGLVLVSLEPGSRSEHGGAALRVWTERSAG